MDYSKIRDAKVRAATGKTWSQWFRHLDSWGARKQGHSPTAKHLATVYGLTAWWSQVVTIRYEKERGYWRPHGTSTSKARAHVERPRVKGTPRRTSKRQANHRRKHPV
jgi:hypothetical protein